MISIFEATAVKTYPVVVFVDGQGTADQAGSKDRCVKSDELPHSRVMVGEDLQLGVEVQIQVDKSSEGSRGVARGHGLETVVDLLPVTRADAAVEHDLAVSICDVTVAATSVNAIVVGADGREKFGRDDRLADSKEVRAQTTNKPLDEDLKDSGSDQGVEQTDGCVVDVPEAASADLNDQEDSKGNEESHQSSSPNRNDLVTHRVSELGIDNLTILEDDGEAAAWCWVSEVNTKTDSAHESHSQDIEPGSLEP